MCPVRLAVTVLLCLSFAGTAPCGVLLDKANDLYVGGRIAESIPVYREALDKGENPALCYFNLANACFQINKLSYAVVYYRACLTHAPDFARGYLNLAIVYYSLNDIGRCIATLRRVRELDPANAKAALMLATCYQRAGEPAQAACLLHRIVEEHGGRSIEADACLMLGETYRDLNDPHEAVRWLARYPSGAPDYAHVLLLLADIYEAEGKLDRALYYADKAFESDPEKRWLLYRTVVLQQSMGNSNVALDRARRGLELFPDFSELSLLAGTLAFGQELYDRAEYYYSLAGRYGSAQAVVGLENVRIMRGAETTN